MRYYSLALLPFLLHACAPNVVDGKASGEIPVPGAVDRVEIVLEKGSISLHKSEDANVHWEAATRKGATAAADLELLERVPMELRATQVGTTLRIEGPRVPVDLANRDPGAALVLKLAIKVPKRVAAVLKTERGPIGVKAWETSVEAHTGAGDIRLEDVTGSAKTFTGSGNHQVTGQRGPIDLTTDHGNFLVYVDEIAPAGVSIFTKAGSIQCNLPKGVGFALEAETKLGEVETVLDVERTKTETGGHRAKGAVHGGGPKVTLGSEIGSVTVREYERP
ncbi:MAG: hypothetical protein KDB80_02910 [Planctomycetes bacterium]|nr:hypothetical protein [Planctomycetota bacterium]